MRNGRTEKRREDGECNILLHFLQKVFYNGKRNTIAQQPKVNLEKKIFTRKVWTIALKRPLIVDGFPRLRWKIRGLISLEGEKREQWRYYRRREERVREREFSWQFVACSRRGEQQQSLLKTGLEEYYYCCSEQRNKQWARNKHGADRSIDINDRPRCD